MPTAVKRCRLNSLTNSDREKLGIDELHYARVDYLSRSTDLDTFMNRRWTIIEFMCGNSNTIDSGGVLVEFYVGSEDP